MSNETENPLTDALKLVQTYTVRSFLNIFGQTVSFEDGFSLELFRGGTHLSSILSSQAGSPTQMKQRFQALDKDILYRVNLGPKIQVVRDKLRTMDGYTREYAVSVELQVIDPAQFIELYRQGADPVNLVILGIKLAIQEYADRTNHEDMRTLNILGKARYAFAGNLRAGIRINHTYEPVLKADPMIQEQIDLERKNRMEINRMEKQAELVHKEGELDFESAKQSETHELALLRMQQEKEKAQYLFELEKDAKMGAHQFRKDLFQSVLSQLMERAGEALQANVPVYEIVEDITALDGAFLRSLPQIESAKTTDGQDRALNGQPPEGSGQAGQDESQSSDAAMPPKRAEIEKQEWGLTVKEVRLPVRLRDLVDEQELAFQVWKVTEGGLAHLAGFQETDILIKINGQQVYTAEACETALNAIQPGEEIKILVLREEMRKLLTLTPPKSNADQE